MARIAVSSGKLILLAGTLAGVVTMFTYVAIQQALRQLANDPQIQLAEDGAAALSQGGAASAIVGNDRVDADTSPAPFTMVLAANGTVEATSGTFGGRVLTPPSGSLDYARRHGQNRFTWQPVAGITQATVVVWNSGPHAGYVVAARSLHEVDLRENELGQFATLTAGAIVAVCAIFAVI